MNLCPPSLSTPSLTFSPQSEQSEWSETSLTVSSPSVYEDACAQMSARDAWWLPMASLCAPAPAGRLQPCSRAASAQLPPWRHAALLADDCWTLRELPWSPSTPGKTKWLSELCHHIDTPPATRFSCVTDDAGRRFVMGPCLSKGTSGKLKLCLPIDDIHEALCVKELRLPVPGTDAGGARKKTIDTPLRNMEQEVALSRAYGGPFAARHSYSVGKRGYIQFPLGRGSLSDFTRHVMPAFRGLMARAVGDSVGRTLCSMHEVGDLHLDVKAPNILVHHEAPFFALGDFGSTAWIDGVKGDAEYGYNSTYCAPEVLQADGFIARSTDMWSLGITLLTVLAPPANYNHISYAATAEGGFDVRGSRTTIGQLQEALEDFVSPTSLWRIANNEADDERHLAILGWLQQCRANDPQLTALITSALLVSHRRRATATDFLRQLHGLPTLPNLMDPQAQLAEMMAWVPVDLRGSPAYAALNQIRVSAHAYAFPHRFLFQGDGKLPEGGTCAL